MHGGCLLRTTLTSILAAFLLLSIGCGGSRSVNGAWEMVYPETGDDSGAARNVKILSDTHFAFGSNSDEGGAFAGGGKYVLSDSTYTEFIQYHTLQFLVGATMEFKCVMEDDKWYHSGSFDINGRKFIVNEIWQRIGE
jgi:hypothetical protein